MLHIMSINPKMGGLLVIFTVCSVSYGQFWRPIPNGTNNNQLPPRPRTTPRPPRSSTAVPRFPCGQPDPAPDAGWAPDMRIIGGKDAPDGSWPFLVALIQNRSDLNNQPYQFCGGSIIATRWILTAGHCVATLTERDIVDNVRVVAGVSYLQDITSSPELALRINRVFKHEEYNVPEGSINNDIALLQLAKPLKFSQTIQPICLPGSKPDEKTMWGMVNRNRKRVAFMAGWGGVTEGQGEDSERVGAGTDVLQQVAIDMYDVSDCRKHIHSSVFTEKMLCGGVPEGGKDACDGDNGGPLVAKDADGRFEQVGIIGWGTGCAKANTPRIFTNVFSLKDWIGTTIITN